MTDAEPEKNNQQILMDWCANELHEKREIEGPGDL